MAKSKITVGDIQISIDLGSEADYVSLTDIAKSESSEPKDVIGNWLRNGSTLVFIEEWEKLHNPDFKGAEMSAFIADTVRRKSRLSPQVLVEQTGAIGIISRSGRHGGGTWAHSDIALNFMYWLSPKFQIYFLKEFQRLKREEIGRSSLEWHVERVTDLLDEARNWMDTIPGQKAGRNRLDKPI